MTPRISIIRSDNFVKVRTYSSCKPTIEVHNTHALQHASSYNIYGFSTLTLLIPLVLVTRLAVSLPTTTLLAVIQAIVCRLWLISNGKLPPDGHISHELCAVPEIDKLYSGVISTLSILDGFGGLIACGVLSSISSRLGRKPAILGVVAISALGYFLMACSQYLPAGLEASILAISLVLQTFSNISVMGFIVTVYTVDISSAEERTPVLSAINGWAALGQTASFAIGGLFTTKTNDPLIVYYIAVTLLGITFIYVLFLLPESFPKEKRDELRRQRLTQQDAAPSGQHNPLNRLISIVTVTFEPLKQLAPIRMEDGRQNWRVFFCASHVVIAMFGETYAPIALLLLYTTKYNYNPAQTGTLLMILGLSSVSTLTWALPQLLRILRPIYAKDVVTPEDQQDSSDETQVVSTSTEHLDVYIAFISWLISAAGYIMAATASIPVLRFIAVIIIGFSAAHTPITRSLVASSVNPLEQGEVLAAIEMMSSIGVFLSPIVMGGIFTATVSTFPTLVFYVHAAIVIGAASLLFLIRASDRYQKPMRARD